MFSIDLRSERDKSVYVWSLGAYLFYNAIITLKRKQTFTLFSFKTSESVVLFILLTAAVVLTQTNLMKSPFWE